MLRSNAEDRFGWPVTDWSKSAGISRASVFQLIADDKIKSVKFGKKRIITTHPREFLASLEA